MAGNFDFLKNKNAKLFNIINDAERLYRDGYFEQAIIQTRKFAENICKITLGVRRTDEETFDDMLSTLKDILKGGAREKEFIDDMYFLKKEGNLAAHNSAVEQGGTVALECLKRAFELSINFAIKSGFANKKIINSNFSIDLLMTGKPPKYSEKYQQVKDEMLKEEAQNIAKLAQTPDIEGEKTIEIDFKNKKRVEKKPKNKKEKNTAKKAFSKKGAPKKETLGDTKKEGFELDLPCLTGALVLLILFICTLIFVFPF